MICLIIPLILPEEEAPRSFALVWVGFFFLLDPVNALLGGDSQLCRIRGGDYEVPIPRVRWMPGADTGVANVQGLTAVEHHRLDRRVGRFEPLVVKKIRNAIGWMLELEGSGETRS